MRLLDRTKEADERVESARYQVDMALLKMAAVLEEAQDQVQKAKEEIQNERAASE